MGNRSRRDGEQRSRREPRKRVVGLRRDRGLRALGLLPVALSEPLEGIAQLTYEEREQLRAAFANVVGANTAALLAQQDLERLYRRILHEKGIENPDGTRMTRDGSAIEYVTGPS